MAGMRLAGVGLRDIAASLDIAERRASGVITEAMGK
jgi:hypothetical protein